MLKKSAFKKIIISSLALLFASVLYLFPDSYKKNEIKKEVNFENIKKCVLYLPNNDNMVSRIMVISKENNVINKAKEIINYLTISNSYNNYIPSGFSPIIPKNTKLLSIDLTNDILKINFSKEFLSVSPEKEKSLIESLVYSLTEIDGINKLMIFVDNNLLNSLPNSKEKLPITIDKSIGINTIYDINDYKNSKLVTTYYLSKYDSFYYYIPISKITNNEDEKIKIIINELKSAPIYQTNLMSFLNSNAKLLDYEILENEVSLSFNNYLLDDITNNTILEEVKYSIGLSIRDTYNINKTIFKVNNTFEELIIK